MALDVSGSIGATPLGRTESSATALWILGDGPAWMRDSSCREHPEVDFFPERGGSLEPARAVCATCLVRDECLAFALEHDERDGVWGGLSRRERRALLRRAG